jgi:hypothetical protein
LINLHFLILYFTVSFLEKIEINRYYLEKYFLLYYKMSDLLPKIIPAEEINQSPKDAFEGDEEIIKQEIQDELDEEDEAVPPKPSVPDEEVFKGVEEKPTHKEKKKRQITDAQREHLAKARVKANEVRKRKAQEKKLLAQQERRRIAKAKKDLEKEMKGEDVNEPDPVLHNPMESEDEEADAPAPTVKPTSVKYKPLSIDDIDEDLLVKLSEMAVEKYDTKRKKRKEEKQKKIKEEVQQQQTYQQVQNAVKPPMDDVWDACFM